MFSRSTRTRLAFVAAAFSSITCGDESVEFNTTA